MSEDVHEEALPLPDLPEKKPLTQNDVSELITRVPYSDAARNPIESHGETSKWTAKPYSSLSSADILKLFLQCKLDLGYGTDPFFHQKSTPVLQFLNTDLASTLRKPDYMSQYRAEITRDSKYKAFQLMGGGEMTFGADLPVQAVKLEVRQAIDASKTAVERSDRICATANAVCAYARVNLLGHVALNQEVVDDLKEAMCEGLGLELSQTYNKLMNKAKEYGTIVVTSCDIGVRADCVYVGEVDESMATGSIHANFKAAAALAVGGGEVGGSSSGGVAKKEAIRRIAQKLTVNVKGPSATVSSASVSDMANFAGDISAYDCVTIHSATTIFDLIPEDNLALRQEVRDALGWHSSWSSVGTMGGWENVEPLNFDYYSVWFTSDRGKVKCHQFATEKEAKEDLISILREGCIFKWNYGASRLIEVPTEAYCSERKRNSIRRAAQEFYEKQREPHQPDLIFLRCDDINFCPKCNLL